MNLFLQLRRLAMLALLLAAGTARATTIHGPADIATLTRAADAVVHARVVTKASHWGQGGAKSGLIFTDIELTPIEQWKGAPVGPRIAVRNPGGEVGDLAQEVVGTASFQPGDEVVVFLRLRAKASSGALDIYEVTRWSLGKFAVGQASPSLPKRAMRSREGVECIGCGPAEEDDLSLEELRARVKAVAEAVRPTTVKPGPP